MSERSGQKTRGVLLACGGLAVALAALLGLHVADLTTMTLDQWVLLVAITTAVQAPLLLIPILGLDDKLRWDHHFVFLPLLATAGLFNLYAYFAPEARFVALMGWLVALLFVAGLADFMEVLGVSLAMIVGYLVVLLALQERGAGFDMAFETGVVVLYLAAIGFAALVYERLRRQRLEMNRLRRELKTLATTDSLTGLPNRRAFEQMLHAELDRLERYGGVCAVAMIDVDHFKSYNDSLGHVAGDEALRELAELMRRKLRTSDRLARYGGEEFTLLMVATPGAEAFRAIDRLRAIVERYPFRDERLLPDGRLTISAGIAAYPADGTDAESLIAAADAALYSAKRGGRNRVESAAASRV